jgi:hypothetical protein
MGKLWTINKTLAHLLLGSLQVLCLLLVLAAIVTAGVAGWNQFQIYLEEQHRIEAKKEMDAKKGRDFSDLAPSSQRVKQLEHLGRPRP